MNILDEMLNATEMMNPTLPNDRPLVSSLISRQVEFPQAKGERHADANGVPRVSKIYIGPTDNVKEGHYYDRVRFLLVDSFLTNVYDVATRRNVTRGGMRMRGYAPNARGVYERDITAPDACRSANGVVPHEQFIGKMVVDPRTGEEHKIGYYRDGDDWKLVAKTVEVNGELVPDICRNCPLSQWTQGRPPCEEAWRYVIYVFPEDGSKGYLATVRGENSGVHNALKGVFKKGSQAARYDGAPLLGIRHTMMPDPKNIAVVAVPRAELREAQMRYVIGTCDDENYTNMVSCDPQNGVREDAKFAVLRVPTSQNFPEGRPELLGRMTKVLPTVMTVTRNGYVINGRPSPTFVPEFKVDDTPLTEEQYTGYMEACIDYASADLRNVFMRTTQPVIATLRETLAAQLGSGAAPIAQQLPSNTSDDKLSM